MEEYFEDKETLDALRKILNTLHEEDREFILYIYSKRGAIQRYYEKHEGRITYEAIKYRKKKLLKKLRNDLKK